MVTKKATVQRKLPVIRRAKKMGQGNERKRGGGLIHLGIIEWRHCQWKNWRQNNRGSWGGEKEQDGERCGVLRGREKKK